MFSIQINTPADLGIALQQARLIQQVSQRELATKVGTSQRYIWELETGKDSPAITRLIDALTILGGQIVIHIPEDVSSDG